MQLLLIGPIIVNFKDLTEVVRCDLIVKKCLPMLLFIVFGFKFDFRSLVDCYKMHVVCRKMFRYIFKLPLRAHLSELLGIFNIEPISVLLKSKYTDFLKVNICTRFDELKFLCQYNYVRHLIV